MLYTKLNELKILDQQKELCYINELIKNNIKEILLSAVINIKEKEL